jgi:hypothetical protein
MPLPEPKIRGCHGVLTVLLDRPVARDEQTTARLARLLATAFPSQSPGTWLPPGAPDELPHLVVQSRSSQLTFSRVQADFEVRFYDEYERSFPLTQEYVEQKLRAALAAWTEIGAAPVFTDLSLTLQYSLHNQADQTPAEFLVAAHLQHEVPSAYLRDARVVLALKIANHYNVDLTLNTYEARHISRPALTGVQAQVVRPWDGTVVDKGLQLEVAVSNRYYAVHNRAHPTVTEDELNHVIRLAWSIAEDGSAAFVENGAIDAASLEGVAR